MSGLTRQKPKKSKVFTPSAEVMWSGEMGPEFRAKANEILEITLTEPAWVGLWKVVFSFAGLLSHDFTAGKESDQQKLVADAERLSSELLDNLERLETMEMGRAVSTLLNDAWLQENDQEAEFDRNLNSAGAELAELVGYDAARRLFGIWAARGLLVRPWPASDFRVNLHIFNAAAQRALRSINDGTAPQAEEPFDSLIVMLCYWSEEHGIQAGATKLNAYQNFGKLTYLVKAILAEVPELHDQNGVLLSKQIRRRTNITDETLAGYVVEARSRAMAARKP